MHKTRILVADDDQNLRNALRVRLTGKGYRVIESGDGINVLSKCLQEQADLVILDHGMPAGDGTTVARMLRRECDAPIIFLSGYTEDTFRPLLTELPNSYFLSKPFSMEALEALIECALRHRAAEPACSPLGGTSS